jgi:hypothetical protein
MKPLPLFLTHLLIHFVSSHHSAQGHFYHHHEIASYKTHLCCSDGIVYYDIATARLVNPGTSDLFLCGAFDTLEECRIDCTIKANELLLKNCEHNSHKGRKHRRQTRLLQDGAQAVNADKNLPDASAAPVLAAPPIPAVSPIAKEGLSPPPPVPTISSETHPTPIASSHEITATHHVDIPQVIPGPVAQSPIVQLPPQTLPDHTPSVPVPPPVLATGESHTHLPKHQAPTDVFVETPLVESPPLQLAKTQVIEKTTAEVSPLQTIDSPTQSNVITPPLITPPALEPLLPALREQPRVDSSLTKPHNKVHNHNDQIVHEETKEPKPIDLLSVPLAGNFHTGPDSTVIQTPVQTKKPFQEKLIKELIRLIIIPQMIRRKTSPQPSETTELPKETQSSEQKIADQLHNFIQTLNHENDTKPTQSSPSQPSAEKPTETPKAPENPTANATQENPAAQVQGGQQARTLQRSGTRVFARHAHHA